MKRFEKIILGLIIGCAFPLFLCLLAFIIWFYLDKSESRVLFYLAGGLLSGLLIDFKFLKDWINKRFELSVWFISGIYVFYNIGLYGMFMGFPVFNAFLGIIAGYYYSHRILFQKITSAEHYKLINQVSLSTGLIMLLICISSGFIALAGEGVGKDVQNMIGLRSEVTKSMILGITLIGGISLIIITVLLTKMTMIQILKNNNAPITQ
jgi:hypothetical protein